MSLLAFRRNQEGFPEVSEESEVVRMFRGLPKTVDLEGDDLDMEGGDLEEYTPTEPDRARRQSSPRSWEIALVPFPSSFAPLPKLQETGVAEEAQWAFPPSLRSTVQEHVWT